MNPRSPFSKPLLAAISVALLTSGTAVAETVVTSLDGALRSGDGPADVHAVLPENESFQTEEGGHCSLMLADEAMVQLCNSASVTFRRRGRTRVVEVMQGEMKATVGPRGNDRPLEIHTPVAIATLLGTVVHVSVDPVTGETTITSIDNRVRVQGVEHGRLDPIVLEPGQQVTVRRGEAPGQVRRIPDMATGLVSECMLTDEELRLAAIAGARASGRQAMADQIALADVPDLTLPSVASSFDAALVEEDQVFDRFKDPVVVGERPGLGSEDPFTLGVEDPRSGSTGGGSGPSPPPGCTGRPGDHCQF